jgi:hypothetical protein
VTLIVTANVMSMELIHCPCPPLPTSVTERSRRFRSARPDDTPAADRDHGARLYFCPVNVPVPVPDLVPADPMRVLLVRIYRGAFTMRRRDTSRRVHRARARFRGTLEFRDGYPIDRTFQACKTPSGRFAVERRT